MNKEHGVIAGQENLKLLTGGRRSRGELAAARGEEGGGGGAGGTHSISSRGVCGHAAFARGAVQREGGKDRSHSIFAVS